MKKMVLSAAVVLALTVASCGNNSTTNNQEQTTEPPVETAPVTASGTYTAELLLANGKEANPQVAIQVLSHYKVEPLL